MRNFTITPESWPVDGEFIISKGACTTAEIVVVEIAEDGVIGRGECERTDKFEDGYPDVFAAVEAMRPAIESGVGAEELQGLMPSGSARNAIDCALWDLAAKRAGVITGGNNRQGPTPPKTGGHSLLPFIAPLPLDSPTRNPQSE